MRAAARSMKYLRGLGYGAVAKTEHWNPFAHKRQDLFGFADLVWLSMSTDYEDGQIVAVQVVNTHLQDHIKKIHATPAARYWQRCGGGIVIHNWKKTGARGKRKTWKLEEIEVGYIESESEKRSRVHLAGGGETERSNP